MSGKLIGICGFTGSGKTELSDGAISQLRGTAYKASRTVKIGFSDPLYDMLGVMGVPEDVLRNKARWNEPLDILCGRSTRYACRELGNEFGRERIGVNVWVNIAIRRASLQRAAGRNVVIDNVRYPNEFEAVRNAGGIIVALHRPGLEIDTSHPSEAFIADLQAEANYTAVNGDSIRNGTRAMREIFIEFFG